MIKAIYKSIKNSFICFVIIFGLIIFPYQLSRKRNLQNQTRQKRASRIRFPVQPKVSHQNDNDGYHDQQISREILREIDNPTGDTRKFPTHTGIHLFEHGHDDRDHEHKYHDCRYQNNQGVTDSSRHQATLFHPFMIIISQETQ